MAWFVVTARSDGRGGIRPFGTYGPKEAGAKVTIGDRDYTVGKDGRVNIPRAVMERYGTPGPDGRQRVVVRFSSAEGKQGWRRLKMEVVRPFVGVGALATGSVFGRPFAVGGYRLIPSDYDEYTWSS